MKDIQQLKAYLKSNDINSHNGPLENNNEELWIVSNLEISHEKFIQFRARKKIKFIKCHFSEITFSSEVTVEFEECTFKTLIVRLGTVSLYNSTFIQANLNDAGNLQLRNCKSIGEVILNSANPKSHFSALGSAGMGLLIKTFSGEIDVSSCTFEHLRFYKYNFELNTKATFLNVTVTLIFQFIDSNLGTLEFHSCDLKKSVHLIENSNIDEVSFIDIKWFKKIYYTRSNNESALDVYKIYKEPNFLIKFWHIITPNIQKHKFYIKDNREFYEAYRKYKLIMSKSKNRPDEIYFKAKEYNAKARQMSLFSRDFPDKLILLFNRFSNNHGMYWLLPIFWLFTFGLFFFYMFASNSNIAASNIISENYAAYLQFLNPTHKLDILGGNVILQDAAIVYDWGFRIISSYFIFQTIIAFRKYKE